MGGRHAGAGGADQRGLATGRRELSVCFGCVSLRLMLQRLSFGLILAIVLAPFSGLACALHCAAQHTMPGRAVSPGSSCCPQGMPGQQMQGQTAAYHLRAAAGGRCLAALMAAASSVAAVRSPRGHGYTADSASDSVANGATPHLRPALVALTAQKDGLPPRLPRSPLRI